MPSAARQLSFLLALLLPGNIFAQILPPPVQLMDLAEAVIAGTVRREDIDFLGSAAQAAVAALGDPASVLVHEGQRLFLMGFAELGLAATGDEVMDPRAARATAERAEALFEAAASRAAEANAMRTTSEGFRVLSDGYNQLLKMRSIPYKMTHAGGARRAAERALELDPANPLAHVAVAAFLTSAPGIVGGDAALGLHHAATALSLAGSSPYVRFVASVWMAKGAAATGDVARARASLDQARRIYPDSWWLREIEEELDLR